MGAFDRAWCPFGWRNSFSDERRHRFCNESHGQDFGIQPCGPDHEV
jgi:hypothetical protein